MKLFVPIVLLALVMFGTLAPAHAQPVFLNGDFEINTAGSTQINLTNAAFNGLMSNTVGFGTGQNLDIISGSTYGLAQPSGNWYIAFTGGTSDQATVRLSANLVAGTSYTFTFYDNAWNVFSSPPFAFGVTNTPGTAGTNFYTGTYTPSTTAWVLRTVTFTAPATGSYIHVYTTGGYSTSVWTKLDRMQFSVVLPVKELNLWGDCNSAGLAKVQWVAKTEGEPVAFEVQRSEFGVDFESVGMGEQVSSDADGDHYVFEEFRTGARSTFYRLKMTDSNGAITYSESVEVLPANQVQMLEVYPTATNKDIFFSLGGSMVDGHWKAQIMTLDGSLVYERQGDGFSTPQSIDVSRFPAGMYILNLVVEGVAEARRFTVLH